MQTGVFFSGGTTCIYSYLVIITSCCFIRVGEIWWHAPPETEAIQQRAEGERSLDTGTLSCHLSKKSIKKTLSDLYFFPLLHLGDGLKSFWNFLPQNLGKMNQPILTHIKTNSVETQPPTRSTPTPKVNPRRAARTGPLPWKRDASDHQELHPERLTWNLQITHL